MSDRANRPAIPDLVETDSPDFRAILSCVFGVRDHESRTYLVLLDTPESTVAELAAELDRDRSNVNRSLTTLLEKGLVERRRRLLDPGGYVYEYTAVPLPEARNCSTRRWRRGPTPSTTVSTSSVGSDRRPTFLPRGPSRSR